MLSGGDATLGVRDLDRAVRFYVETLGMKLVEQTDTSSVIDAGDGFLLGLRKGPDAGSGAASIGFGVKGRLEDVVAVYENRGVVFDRSQDGVARFADPDGNALHLRG